jgi:hypothetical protein
MSKYYLNKEAHPSANVVLTNEDCTKTFTLRQHASSIARTLITCGVAGADDLNICDEWHILIPEDVKDELIQMNTPVRKPISKRIKDLDTNDNTHTDTDTDDTLSLDDILLEFDVQ